ncbi:MAG: tail fiber domain-containing protein [Bdellovibrionaceae bacterium]|nr:tail fiber domain-containing protein [Pseudobdellovibrionaceae bacterium]
MKNTGPFAKFFISLGLSSLLASVAQAVPHRLTYQGRLLQPDGQPINSNGVMVTVRIASDSTEDCTLLEETHNVNFAGTDGNFSIAIGGGVRGGDDVGLSLASVFSNTGTRTGLHCASGGSFVTGPDKIRKMYLSFDDAGTVVNFTDPYIIRSVPYALEADTLAGGFQADHLCRVADAGVPQAVGALTSTNFTELMNLINGSSAQYSRASGNSGTQVTVDPSSPANGTVWIDSGTGTLKFRSGGTTKTLDPVPASAVTTGTYTSVTVDATGRVTAGTSPTTLAGYGITDAVKAGGQDGALTLGTSNNTALTINTNNNPRVTVLSGGNVGIGTATPAGKLNVEGDLTLSMNGVVSKNCIRNYTGLTTAAPASLVDCSGTALALNRQYRLTAWVAGTSLATGAQAVVTSDGTNFLLYKDYEAGTTVQHPEFFLNAGVPSLRLYNSATAYLVSMLVEELDYPSSSNRGNPWGAGILYKNGAGNVGIGTTNPGSRLTVSDTAGNPTVAVGPTQAAAGGAATLQLIGKNGGSSSTSFFQAGWNGALTYQSANGSHAFLDGTGTTRLHLTGGNLGVGVTPTTYKLDVNGDVRIENSATLYFGTTAICSVTGCPTPSDKRYKKDIEPLRNSLEKIQRLQGVSYDWIEAERFGNQHQVGFIAQDVEQVYPEVVHTDQRTGFKSVAYDKLVAPVIESLKALIARLSATDERVTALEAENARLKAYLCRKDPAAPLCD